MLDKLVFNQVDDINKHMAVLEEFKYSGFEELGVDTKYIDTLLLEMESYIKYKIMLAATRLLDETSEL